MKSVLISINPKWCELIANSKKTIEIRKTRPKLETPFKCYIYQTRNPVAVSLSGTGRHISEYDKTYYYNERSGKVIGALSTEEKIGEFMRAYPSIDSMAKHTDLFRWHHVLTGSCDMGRREFAREHGLSVENGEMTVAEFIELTENAYGGSVIKMLKERYK